jgi:UDP-N-acetylglucosamine transferase subunit ALG13
MILVTVGTHNQGFDRLVRAADEMAALSNEDVIIQYGSAVYEPQYAARRFRFTTSQEMEDLTARARVIVMHAAAGSLILSLRLKKPLVVVPRLRKHNEVIDNHQIQLATALDEKGRAVSVMDPSGEILLQAIRQAVSLDAKSVDNGHLLSSLQKQMSDWSFARKK